MQSNLLNQIERNKPAWSSYSGHVILLNALQCEEHSQAKVENLQGWKALKPDIEIIDINQTHDGLYEDVSLFPYYMSLVRNVARQ